MSSLQRKELWEKTDRWGSGDVDIWFKTNLRMEADSDGDRSKELGLAFTHEEPMTNMVEQYIPSYKDLPFYVYQFQTKFRNEVRAKGGIMRTREFVMKDLYSFSKDQNEHEEFYEKVKQAYLNIFSRVGLGDITYLTFASGGSFSQFSHEFQTVTDAGEDIIYIDESKKIAINKEVYNDNNISNAGLDKNSLKEVKATEVGNIFTLGTRFSERLLSKYRNEKGEQIPVFMGSYGIGPARVMGAIVEIFSDEKGIIWPDSIAPFNCHLIEIKGSEETTKRAESLYKKLQDISVTTLYDDRDARAGEKFADADLIGIPWHVIVSDRGTEDNTVEVKHRKTGNSRVMSEAEFLTGKFTDLAA